MAASSTEDRVTAPAAGALRGRFVLAEVLEDDSEPPADLVPARRPAVSDLIGAVAVLGAFGDGSYLAGQLRVSLLTLLGRGVACSGPEPG
jgi:hypothetical protein